MKTASGFVSREPMTSQVARLIQSAIMRGEYPLGARLIESEIAQKYEISRHVVREALQVLEGEGIVINDPFCGRSVFNPSAKDIEGLYLLRISLESVAASLAAYKIKPKQAQVLMNLGFQYQDSPKDYVDLLEMDFNIHRKIWEIADEPMLTKTLEKLLWPFMLAAPSKEGDFKKQGETAVMAQLEREESGEPEGHMLLLKAICSQDTVGAREQMTAHLISSTCDFSRETLAALEAVFGKLRP
jgi:DNA-binding GntR family transcriptional regulator